MERVNATLTKGHKKFKVLENLATLDTRCYWFKMKWKYCKERMVLCPPQKTLELNLQNHLAGLKHQKAMEDSNQAAREPARTCRLGQPNKSSNTSGNSNQGDLHAWLRPSSSIDFSGTSDSVDKNFVVSFMCYGFKGPIVEYGGFSYSIKALLNDPNFSGQWYPKPHLHAVVHVDGVEITVSGAFRHTKCYCVSLSSLPFPNLTCSMCTLIPSENDFRLRIKREDMALVKRGQRSTTTGI